MQMNRYRWGRKKQVYRRPPKASYFGQKPAVWRWQAFHSPVMVMQRFLWCNPRQKQAGWWKAADDAELGCRKAMYQVLLHLDEMHLSRAAGVLFSTVASTRSTVGRKGTWSQHLPPIFGLCSKARVHHWCVAAPGDLLGCFARASPHGSMVGTPICRILSFMLRWVGLFESLTQGRNA